MADASVMVGFAERWESVERREGAMVRWCDGTMVRWSDIAME